MEGCSSAKHLQKVFLIQERAIRYMKKKQKDKSSKELLENNKILTLLFQHSIYSKPSLQHKKERNK